MKSRSVLGIAILVIAGGALGPLPAAGAAEPAAAAEASAEARQAVPAPDADKGGAQTQVTPGEESTPTPLLTATDSKTYQQQKKAAATAPSGDRPDVPPVRGGPTTQVVTTLFNGLDRPGSANNGSVFNPPDTIVGKSPNRIVEATNSAVRLSTATGTALQTLDLNTFTGAAIADGRLFDPKVYYDRNAANPRVFVTALQVAGRDNTNAADDVSRIWIAISRAADPASLSAGWCFYNIEGRRNVGTADASWSDYPGLGAGADSFSVTTNQFRFTNRTFTFAIIRTFNKTIAENNAASCPTIPFFTFQPAATAGDGTQFTIQPAQHYTSPSSFLNTTNPAYFLSTTSGTSNQYHVWRVRNVASGAPTLAHLILTSTGYGVPPDSPQPGGTGVLIDTGDNRILQTGAIGNTVIGTLTTVCNFTGGTANESCTLTPRVAVGATATGGLTASIVVNVFTGLGDNIFVHHNSIAPNSALQAAATWEFSGAGAFLSSEAMIASTGGGWTRVQTYAPGTCTLPATAPSTTTARSGDYSGAQTDPNLNTQWIAGEQAVTISGTCQWRTRIAQHVP
ncbi:hypothetical protein [Virgisporangium aurantiacum]|uniref:Uncharacterized protein n=1 Tax=Virgisporangium aurantiacum TaxID=175570 RepID=A0A8J3ZFH2_9ACTN|nr:hypothetical protein [Virgisporangium aurantiacum]GIJ63152.1 hypothetical protein Vau01_106680 [Virgisporangium aurantiacum]